MNKTRPKAKAGGADFLVFRCLSLEPLRLCKGFERLEQKRSRLDGLLNVSAQETRSPALYFDGVQSSTCASEA